MDRVWQAISRHYKINVAQAKAEIPHFYEYIGELRYWDFHQQLSQQFGFDPDEVITSVRPDLEREDFLYPDTKEFLALQGPNRQLHILTFGEEWTQRAKLSLSPALAGLPCDIILEAKGDYIAQHFSDVQGWLIDDKLNSHMPSHIRSVWLDRASDMEIHKKDDIIIVNSLKHVQEVL
jgi:hypothetical protein